MKPENHPEFHCSNAIIHQSGLLIIEENTSNSGDDSDTESISDEAFLRRHKPYEEEEVKRYNIGVKRDQILHRTSECANRNE